MRERFSEIEGLSISQRSLEERLKEYRTESENRSDVTESAQNRGARWTMNHLAKRAALRVVRAIRGWQDYGQKSGDKQHEMTAILDYTRAVCFWSACSFSNSWIRLR